MQSSTVLLFLAGSASLRACGAAVWAFLVVKYRLWIHVLLHKDLLALSITRCTSKCLCVCIALCACVERGDRDNIVLPEIYQRQQDCFSPPPCFFLCFIPVSISPASSRSIHCPPPNPYPPPLLVQPTPNSSSFRYSLLSKLSPSDGAPVALYNI